MKKKKFEEPELQEAEERLKPGDTIKCSNADEMIELSTELAKEDIQTDFEYEKNGEKGYWLIITSVKQGGSRRE